MAHPGRSRRLMARSLVFAKLAALSVVHCPLAAATPNIVLVLADDHRGRSWLSLPGSGMAPNRPMFKSC